MKRRVESWSIEKLHKARPRIAFPEYQREPNLWSLEKRRLLIDSIFRDIDIPKLYFNETSDGTIEVVDGTQRLWSVWEYIDDQYTFPIDGQPRKYSELLLGKRRTIQEYELQVTILEDASDDYLRELFVRLQLGLLLVTGEKLNAATGSMKDFVFKKMTHHSFIDDLKIPKRRFAKQTLGAQIAINSFSMAKLNIFSRTRYEDLLFFFEEYKQPTGKDIEFFHKKSKAILVVLDDLAECFGTRSNELTNRSYILSVYLLFEVLRLALDTPKAKRVFVEYIFALWSRLKQEARSGIDRSNRELYSFESMLSSAPGERYQIERRHQKLLEYYDYFKARGKIKGD